MSAPVPEPAAASFQIRPLARPVMPVAGESLIGLVARATRLNVLGSTNVILSEAGLDLLHPGTLGQHLGEFGDRVATQLGCASNDIYQRCHPYLGDNAGPSDIRWGSGALMRPHVLVYHRKVSPASLRTSSHHRGAWMNRLLPYCPESLELLIDTCSTCGRRQGWRNAWGIDTCDDRACRSLLSHATGEKLPGELAADYRFFAAIVSSDPEERNTALTGLHPGLLELPPAVLVSLILQLGSTISAERTRLHKNTIQNLEPKHLASIVSRGANLIRDWPKTFRQGVIEEMICIGLEHGSEQRRFVTVVRKLGDRTVRPEQAALIHDALPEASEHAGMAFSKLLTPAVNGSEVCRRCSLNPADLRSLRDHDLIPYRMALGTERIQAQYDAAAVSEMETAFRQSALASRLEQKLGIPRYASEQLACLGVIEREDHPALLHVESRLCLRKATMEKLIRDLDTAGNEGPRPPESLKLRTAMKRFGGGPKPWGALLASLLAGETRFWIEGSGRFVRRAYVILGDLERFAGIGFDESAWPKFPFQQFMTQIDANEVLNLDSLQLRRVLKAGELSFKPSGVSVITDRADVLGLARQTIAAGEIALRLGVYFVAVPGVMSKNYPEVGRNKVGWNRQDFERLCLGARAEEQSRLPSGS